MIAKLAAMNLKFSLRGKTLVAVLLFTFAIISLKIMRDSSNYNKVSFEGYVYRSFQKSSTRFMAVQNLNVLQLQKEKVENVKASKTPPELNSKTITNSGLGSKCKIRPGGFKSWTRGSITKLTPEIHANCTLLFKGGDELEVAQVLLTSYTWPAKKYALIFEKRVKESHCTHFKDELEDNFYTTKEELDFPLAFAMLIHNSPFQVYRLLKVIYRPHNIYCIHYDSRSSEDLKLLFNKLSDCFDNIIISSVIREVYWGHHSLMDAQMNCFRDLLKRHHEYPWRYVITLCGKELPLRTNKEMVQLLWRLKGSSAVRSIPLPKYDRIRYEKKWTLDKNTSKLVPTDENTGPIPYDLKMYKSMTYFALTPSFVNYTLNDEVAVALSTFLKEALIPEESFYSTLFMISGTIIYLK
jgi:hypothetical protein